LRRPEDSLMAKKSGWAISCSMRGVCRSEASGGVFCWWYFCLERRFVLLMNAHVGHALDRKNVEISNWKGFS